MKHFRIGKNKHNYTHPRKPRYASQDATAPQNQFDGTLKVITYNIKLSKKIHKAVELLDKHDDLDDADIICLQEMDPEGVKLIARALGYNYVYYPAILHPRSRKDFGNAILSKWPIVDDEKIILPRLGVGKLQRIAVCATLAIDNIRVTVICVHMKVFVRRRQRHIPINCIINAIEPSAKHCIVAGDFNTFSKSNCRTILNLLKEADFHLVTNAIGWTYKYWYLLNKKSTLDHIFTKGMDVINAGKVVNRTPSDHVPIWGELAIS